MSDKLKVSTKSNDAKSIFQYILDKDREAEQVDQPTDTQDLLGEKTGSRLLTF